MACTSSSVPIDYTENTRVLIDELREKLKQVDRTGTRERSSLHDCNCNRVDFASYVNDWKSESAMSEKINEQAEKMREMAQTTLDKAKEAVSKYMAESQKLREKADSGVRATYSSAKEMNEKAVALPRQM